VTPHLNMPFRKTALLNRAASKRRVMGLARAVTLLD
jgi:hypothetical protein